MILAQTSRQTNGEGVLMSKKAKKHRNTALASQPAGKRSAAGTVGLVLGVAMPMLAVSWWAWPGLRKPESASQSRLSSEPAGKTDAAPRSEFQRLKGRWVRPDGGYVVDVREIDVGGRMDTSYFNPKPIHVSQARASQEGTATRVFMELRDVNYPGSTYNLTYNAREDQLEGVYYQAFLQQSFDVVFRRTP